MCLGVQRLLGAILIPLMLVLAFGIVSIAGAAAREAPLEPGIAPDSARIGLARKVMAIAGLIVAGALAFGWWWWNSEDGIYRQYVFKPLALNASGWMAAACFCASTTQTGSTAAPTICCPITAT